MIGYNFFKNTFLYNFLKLSLIFYFYLNERYLFSTLLKNAHSRHNTRSMVNVNASL